MAHDHSHPHHDHDHDHTHGGVGHVHSDTLECCSHHDMDVERYLFVFLVGGVLAIVSWIAHLTGMTGELVSTLPAIAAALLLGSWLIVAAVREILDKRVSSSSLAALAILAAMAVGKYGTAAFLAFILLVADQIVRRTASGAQRAIEQLVRL
ncbi:MAG: hypothetical protein KC996_02425, partial [Phycisphaerales bacterium]|nr:hypothetical protein [Phycisphaerales bacterium]